MDLGIAGRGALITGASSGIGLAIARALAAEGVRIAIAARSSDGVAAAVEALGGTAAGHRGYAVDLAEPGGPAQLLAACTGFGDIDIVVHNIGGTLSVNDPLAPVEQWRDVSRLNLEIAIELNAALIPPMRERRWGRAISILSLGTREHSGTIAYGTVKAALGAYTRGLARNVAADNVVVSGVAPGATITEGGHWAKQTAADPQRVEAYLANETKRGSFVQPDEVASVVAFLASERASGCAGTFVSVDAGQGRSYEMP